MDEKAKRELKMEIGEMLVWASNLRTEAEIERGLGLRRVAIDAFKEGRYDVARSTVNLLRANYRAAQQ